MSLGDNIRNIRKQHNMSQKEFAKTLHISQQAVTKWENDKSFPQIDRLKDISEELSVPEMSVLFDDIEMKYYIPIDLTDETNQRVKELKEKSDLSLKEKFELILTESYLKETNGKRIIYLMCTEYEYNLYKAIKQIYPNYSLNEFNKILEGTSFEKIKSNY